jgi:hypothetical protein
MPEESTTATADWVDFHVTLLVISCWLKSLNTPVTVNCLLPPNATTAFAGETESDFSVLGVGPPALGRLFPPQPTKPLTRKTSIDAAARFFLALIL